MTICERIKYLRKDVLGMTQQEFADKLSVKRNTIANYESGRNEPVDSVKSLICREYNVRKEWLEEGTGEMFKPESGTPLGSLAEEYHLSEDDVMLIYRFINMTSTQRQLFIYHVQEIIKFAEVIIES